MVNKLLKIENTGKHLLRIGISVYMVSIALFSFKTIVGTGTEAIQNILLFCMLIITPVLLLTHYKIPKAGIVGGILSMLLFLGSAVYVGYNEQLALTPFRITFLHTIKDVLLAFGGLVLTGESLKEMVREKITKPFPQR